MLKVTPHPDYPPEDGRYLRGNDASARNNGFEIHTRKETYGRWNYFALVLIM